MMCYNNQKHGTLEEHVNNLEDRVTEIEESGGGEGTKNYNELNNKPSINGVTLTGNKTSADLGIVDHDTTYTAGTGLKLTGTTFSSKTTFSLNGTTLTITTVD